MKPEQIYQGLKDLADRLGIVVSEQKLSTERLKVKSGLCKIRGRFVMIRINSCPSIKNVQFWPHVCVICRMTRSL